MRIDYKRKLTKQELTNLTTKLGAHESYGNMQGEYFARWRAILAQKELESVNEVYSKYAEV